MEQYIKKSEIVAEIKERINKEIQSCATDSILGYSQGCIDSMRNVLSLINTLEVKEMGVDLGDPKGDKSAKYIIDTKTLKVKEVNLEKEIELVKGDYEQVDVAWNNDFDFIARHFFELGLKANKGG